MGKKNVWFPCQNVQTRPARELQAAEARFYHPLNFWPSHNCSKPRNIAALPSPNSLAQAWPLALLQLPLSAAGGEISGECVRTQAGGTHMWAKTIEQQAEAGNEVSTSFQWRKWKHWLPLEKSKQHCFRSQNRPGENKGFGMDPPLDKMLSRTDAPPHSDEPSLLGTEVY